MVLTLVELLLIGGCTSPAPLDSGENGAAAASCTEPENPYTEGTGHYAGYEWAENKGSGTCAGSSQSFVEGCEEYEAQESEYQECEDHKEGH